MWNKKDLSIEIQNQKLKSTYARFLNNLNDLSIFYLISLHATNLYSQKKPIGEVFKLSNNFDELLTTTIKDSDALQLIDKGEYLKKLKMLTIVSMCASFESFIDELLEVVELDKKKASEFNSYDKIYSLKYKSDSKVFRKLYFIINQYYLDVPIYTNSVDTLKMLDEIIVLRNVIIHFDGIIKKENHYLSIKPAHKDQNSHIKILDNSIDDFIHRFILCFNDFVKKLDVKLVVKN